MADRLEIAALTRAEFDRHASALPRAGAVAGVIYRRALLEGVFDARELVSEEQAVAWHDRFALTVPGNGRRTTGAAKAAGRLGATTSRSRLGPPSRRLLVEGSGSGDRETCKAVVDLGDGLEVEMVRIPMGRGRHTLCISSQVGCKMGCRFCETARLGLLRPMAVHEVVGQLLTARHSLGWAFERVVFMGMGEPLDHPEILFQVLRVLTDPGGLAMPHESLTVCTVGVVAGIEGLAELGMKRLNLSVSLNAANDALRDELMPVNRRSPLAKLQEALVAYRPRANFQLGVNYCLLPGLNDRREDARDIARFCAPLGRVQVNVIPYNPGNAPLTRAATDDEVTLFVGWLREEGLRVRRRVTKGRETMAACGQLGNVGLREGRRRLPVA